MQTRCPACQTLYRIDEDVLKRAGGQARCFRCDTVFDAYRNPAGDKEGTSPADKDSDPLSELSQLSQLPDVPEPSGVDPDRETRSDDLTEHLRRLEPELRKPRSRALDEEDLTESLLRLEPTPSPPLGVERSHGAQAAGAPDPARPRDGDARPDEKPIPETSPFDSTPKPARSAPSWTVFEMAVAAVLLVVALAQLAWLNRDQVLATPQGQTVAELVCGVLHCELPPRRAPSRYVVLDRSIAPDPARQGVLLMQLSFRNSADFAQPLPDIQLSLYDSEGQLTARRRLHPEEYAFPAPPDGALIGSQEVVQVVVKLEDPGRHATGFKLEFL